MTTRRQRAPANNQQRDAGILMLWLLSRSIMRSQHTIFVPDSSPSTPPNNRQRRPTNLNARLQRLCCSGSIATERLVCFSLLCQLLFEKRHRLLGACRLGLPSHNATIHANNSGETIDFALVALHSTRARIGYHDRSPDHPFPKCPARSSIVLHTHSLSLSLSLSLS